MKTDSLFYRIFQTAPEVFFALNGCDYSAQDYTFQATEIKQTAFRLDGVFKPNRENAHLPTIFVEVQFQADAKFYSRFLSEIFLYLHHYPQTNPCKAVVIYPERKTEIDTLTRYADFIHLTNIKRIYLNESVTKVAGIWQLNLLELIISSPEHTPILAKQLLSSLTVSPQVQESLIDLIETILTYKFPQLTRDEVKKMLHLPDIHLDIRTTQFYRDVYFEGRQEGRQEGEQKGRLNGEIKVILNLLNRRFGKLNPSIIEQIKGLELSQLDVLADQLLEFKQLDELINFLNQFNKIM